MALVPEGSVNAVYGLAAKVKRTQCGIPEHVLGAHLQPHRCQLPASCAGPKPSHAKPAAQRTGVAAVLGVAGVSKRPLSPIYSVSWCVQVWQQRLECEETERRALQQRFDSTVASLQQSAAATTLLLSKHAESTSRLDLDPSGEAAHAWHALPPPRLGYSHCPAAEQTCGENPSGGAAGAWHALPPPRVGYSHCPAAKQARGAHLSP